MAFRRSVSPLIIFSFINSFLILGNLKEDYAHEVKLQKDGAPFYVTFSGNKYFVKDSGNINLIQDVEEIEKSIYTFRVMEELEKTSYMTPAGKAIFNLQTGETSMGAQVFSGGIDFTGTEKALDIIAHGGGVEEIKKYLGEDDIQKLGEVFSKNLKSNCGKIAAYYYEKSRQNVNDAQNIIETYKSVGSLTYDEVKEYRDKIRELNIYGKASSNLINAINEMDSTFLESLKNKTPEQIINELQNSKKSPIRNFSKEINKNISKFNEAENIFKKQIANSADRQLIASGLDPKKERALQRLEQTREVAEKLENDRIEKERIASNLESNRIARDEAIERAIKVREERERRVRMEAERLRRDEEERRLAEQKTIEEEDEGPSIWDYLIAADKIRRVIKGENVTSYPALKAGSSNENCYNTGVVYTFNNDGQPAFQHTAKNLYISWNTRTNRLRIEAEVLLNVGWRHINIIAKYTCPQRKASCAVIESCTVTK